MGIGQRRRTVFDVVYTYMTDTGTTMDIPPTAVSGEDPRHDSGLQRLEDFFENVIVYLPRLPGGVNRKDDLLEPTDKLIFEQDCFHLFSNLARWATVRSAAHGTYSHISRELRNHIVGSTHQGSTHVSRYVPPSGKSA